MSNRDKKYPTSSGSQHRGQDGWPVANSQQEKPLSYPLWVHLLIVGSLMLTALALLAILQAVAR